MRLRNVKGSRETIAATDFVIHDPVTYKGKWRELFGNDNPIHIEVGMGKGKFLMRLAELNPNINYIGIEKYSSVLIRAVEKKKETEGLDNLYFIRFDAEEITEIFEKDEIDRIYLNFSDPWPKDRHAKRRLTSRQFLARYDQFLKREGEIIFKTDNLDLFNFSLEEAKEANWNIVNFTYDLHNSEYVEGNVMTEYEEKFTEKGNKINRMVINRQSSKQSILVSYSIL